MNRELSSTRNTSGFASYERSCNPHRGNRCYRRYRITFTLLSIFTDDRDTLTAKIDIAHFDFEFPRFSKCSFASAPSDLTNSTRAFGNYNVVVEYDIMHDSQVEFVTLFGALRCNIII